MKRKLILGSLAIAIAAIAFNYIDVASVDAASKGDKKALETSAAPNLSTTLVISQVNGGGGGTTGTYLFDYVEIKNISSTPQSLNGLSLYYGSATGQFASTAGNAFALPNVTLNPGQYYFVQTGPTGSVGAAFPVTPDVVTANLTMSGTSGKVALATAALPINTCGATATPCSPTQLAAIVDWVAYGAAGNGTAGNGEGGTSVNNGVAITSSQGSVRKTGGCTETDNNNLDFDVVTAPVPRNMASTAAPCSATPQQNVVDFNGDGKTDFAVVRNTGGGPTGQITWFIQLNGGGLQGALWGLNGDRYLPEDYDGDNKSDIAVWRGGAPTVAAFYILQSATNTLRIELFGQTGDDPTVVGDYDGDGKADVAVYRPGANSGQQSTWFYRGTLSNPSGNVTFVPWGINGDFPAPGNYDGDGKNDFVVQRNDGGGQARFWMLQTTAGFNSVVFGTPTDVIVPGDYDGDGKTDIATARGSGASIVWFVRPSSTGTVSAVPTATFGVAASDFFAQGDYDGDGKTDIAIWRSTTGTFWYLGSTSGALSAQFGQTGDVPVASYNAH